MLPSVQSKISSAEFQITDWQTQIAELQARIAASQTRITRLNEDNAVADGLLQAAQAAKGKISDQEVIADLLAQLSQMLGGGDNPGGSNGGNPPLEPAPQPNADGGEQEPEEAQALPWHELPFDFEKQAVSEEVVLEPETTIAVEPLTGQSCEFNPDAYWETAQPDGSAWDWASPLASPLATPLCCEMEDAPQSVLTGQSVDLAQIAFTRHGFKYIDDAIAVETSATLDTLKEPNYFELIPVSDVIAYFRNNKTGEIVCTYLGGNNKQKLKLWGEWLCHQHSVGSGFQLREAERLTAFRHELKIWGMSLSQIQKLAESNTTKNPPSNFGTAPKRKVESEILEAVDRLTGSDDALTTDWKLQAKSLEVRLDNISPGHYLAYHQYRKLGEVIEKHDADSPYYVNRNQRTMLNVGAGDGQKYFDPHEAAIGLAKFLKVIKDAEESKADLFGGGFDVPALADAFGGFSF